MASMHNSLEVRVPLLDKEVVETSLNIDPFYSMRNSERKAILKELLSRFMPQDIITQEKRGFAVPLGVWLRGPLRQLGERLLFDGPLFPTDIFDQSGLRRYWTDHLEGRRNLKWGLWTLLSLQWWSKKVLV